jgi:hypothetical protein
MLGVENKKQRYGFYSFKKKKISASTNRVQYVYGLMKRILGHPIHSLINQIYK